MRIILGDLLTGRRILDVPYKAADWDLELNGPGTVKATVDLRDPSVAALDLGNSATPGKSFLAAVEGDIILEAGQILPTTYSRDDGTLTLTARGLWSYFDDRTLLPYIGDLPVVDPVSGESSAYSNSYWSGMHLGTIGKRIIQQSLLWPGGNLPIVFEADKPGTNERRYTGAELNIIGQMLENLTGVEGGPDIEFRPRWSSDRLGVEWFYRSGDPRLSSSGVHRWNASIPESPINNLTVDSTAAHMGSLGWCSGGRSADVALVERALDPTLLNAGFPLRERVDSSRSTVVLRQTVIDFATELARTGAKPRSVWKFDIHTGGRGEPIIGQFGVGDYVEITIKDDPFIPDGKHLRRIVTLGGSAGSAFVKVGLGENYG